MSGEAIIARPLAIDERSAPFFIAVPAAFKAMAMGADAAGFGSAAEIAMGCRVCYACQKGNCPYGITSQKPEMRARHGLIGGVFLAGYGIARIVCEFFREPDPQLGFLFGGATMGMLLSLPLCAVGVWLIVRSLHDRA